MSQFKQEDVKGVVRNSDTSYTAVLNSGEKRRIDSSEYSSLERRLDKDRSRMEREGTRAPERDPEKRQTAQQASERQERERREIGREIDSRLQRRR